MDTNTTAIEPSNTSFPDVLDRQGNIILATAADIKALNTVETVIDWLREHHSHNYTEAFNALGILRKQFYDSLRKPYVQQALVDRLRDRHQAELEMIGTAWYPIYHHQMLIAMGQVGLPKDAVAAAKFLHEREQYLQTTVESVSGEEIVKSEASIMLERFRERYGDGKSTMKAKRTTVTEEISVQ